MITLSGEDLVIAVLLVVWFCFWSYRWGADA